MASSATELNNDRHVRFQFALESVRRISRLSSYNLGEILAVWGDDEEEIQRRDELKRDASEYIEGGRRSSDNYTFTSIGLCDHVGSRREEKEVARCQMWDAVLDEQDNQRQAQENTGHSPDVFKYNSALLAMVCKKVTQKSQQLAYENAKELEREIADHEQEKTLPVANGSSHTAQHSVKRKHGTKSRKYSSSRSHRSRSNSRRRKSESESLAISKTSQHYPRTEMLA